jgi:hypothetical protein
LGHNLPAFLSEFPGLCAEQRLHRFERHFGKITIPMKQIIRLFVESDVYNPPLNERLRSVSYHDLTADEKTQMSSRALSVYKQAVAPQITHVPILVPSMKGRYNLTEFTLFFRN